MRWLVPILVGLLVLLPASVGAQDPDYADITVTAQGVAVMPPQGFTVYYVSDYEIYIEWSVPASANNTLVRAAYGRPVEDRDDGFELYYGTGDNVTHWVSNIGTVGPIYYAAWSETAGTWDEIGAVEEANFMSVSFLFAILVILGLVLFIAAFRWKDMLLSYAAALTWMAIGFWWIIDDITNFGLSDPWVQILVLIPFILAFTVLLRLMNTEIVNESKGQRWTDWGAKPTVDKPDRRTEYRRTLKERMNR